VLSEFIELQLPSTPCFTWRTAIVSSQDFIHYYFYGSSHYRFFVFVTFATHIDEIVLSSYEDHNVAMRNIVISRAKKHLAVSFCTVLEKI
jgi:hypothetical protein